MKHAANRRRGVSTRAFVALLALVLVIGCVAGGTIAWLVSTPDSVINTFTYGDINIELKETTGEDYKIIPGVDIGKDPKVTVEKNSEACWLFVEVKEAGTFVANKVTYSVADGWTKGDDMKIPANVYYREVGAVTADTDFYVLKDNKVYVSEDLNKGDIQSIATQPTQPTLTFTAYAVQKDNVNTAEAAWAIAKPATTP